MKDPKKVFNFAEGFDRRYLNDIKEEFEGYRGLGTWTLPIYNDGEVILPVMTLENGNLVYKGMIIKPNENPIITDPFLVTIVFPDVFYETSTKELKRYINGLMGLLDEERRNSFKVEVKKGFPSKEEFLPEAGQKSIPRYFLEFD